MGRTLPRRTFLAGALATGTAAAAATTFGARAAGAATASADVAWSAPAWPDSRPRANSSRAASSVLVLEARDRVGGRVLNHPIGGGHVAEAGGEFVGPTQDRIVALAARSESAPSTPTTPARTSTSTDRSGFGTRDTGPLGTAPPDPLLLADIVKLSQQIDLLAAKVPVDAAVDGAGRGALRRADPRDLGTRELRQRRRHPRPARRRSPRRCVGAEPRDLSFLFVLAYVAAAGNDEQPRHVRAAVQRARRRAADAGSSAARS